MPGLPLSIVGLRLAFGEDTVIDLAKLDIAPGSITVLSGPSGSGKSTLLNLLSGLLLPDAGTIAWNGTDIVPLNESGRDRWRRHHAGFIFQDFHLIEELSPLDNVVAPAWFSRFSAASLRPAATKRLLDLGVPQRRYTNRLSRGEKQRVAIARALIGNPLVIFADEPTASLDPASGNTVIAILADLAHVDGRTVIAASHDPALLARADLIVRLDHGQAVTIEKRA